MKKIFCLSFVFFIFDQMIKLFVDQKMILNTSLEIIPNFFNITYVRNTGAAFSILSGNRLFLIIIALIALYFIYQLLIKNKNLLKCNIITNSFLISGIMGNMIDRIFRGYVIDYLDFNLFGYHFPVFNLADICIVLGCFLLVVLTAKEENHGDNSKRGRH